MDLTWLQFLLSLSLHLWPCGVFTISWQRKRFEPDLHMRLCDMHVLPKSEQLWSYNSFPGQLRSTVMKGSLSNGRSGSPWSTTIPQGNQPSQWRQVDYTGPLLSWKKQRFALNGIDIYLEYEFAFPAFNASAKSTICGLAACFFNHHVILHGIPSDQGTQFTAKEVP